MFAFSLCHWPTTQWAMKGRQLLTKLPVTARLCPLSTLFFQPACWERKIATFPTWSSKTTGTRHAVWATVFHGCEVLEQTVSSNNNSVSTAEGFILSFRHVTVCVINWSIKQVYYFILGLSAKVEGFRNHTPCYSDPAFSSHKVP